MDNDFPISCDISEEFMQELKQLSEIKEKDEYILGVRTKDNNLIRLKGNIKADIHSLFKKRKKGNKYKYFKTKYITLKDLKFIFRGIIDDKNK